MTKQELNRFNGHGISLTQNGPIFYCFDTNKIDMIEFINLEHDAFIEAKLRQYYLFKFYNTNSIEHTVVGLN